MLRRRNDVATLRLGGEDPDELLLGRREVRLHVQHQPISLERPHQPQQVVERHRLHEVGIGAEVVRPIDIDLVP